MSGLIGFNSSSETGLVDELVLGAVSAPNSGASSGFNHGPTGINLSWYRRGSIVHFWGQVRGGASSVNLYYDMLPYRLRQSPISVNVSSFDATIVHQSQRIDENSRRVYWKIASTGGGGSGNNYYYYFDITYMTDGRL